MINEDDDVTQQYGFEYTDCDGKVYKKQITTAGATWHECMDDYVKFLESVFGYSIKDQVRLEEPKWLDTVYEHYPAYLDPWTGEYFVKDEVQDDTYFDRWDD